MTSVSSLALANKLKGLQVKFVTPRLISQITGVTKANTLYKILLRLESHSVLKRLDKGKYLVSSATASEFEIANFLIQPSYISLESALSFYGIMPQFPYTITSVTTNRSKKIVLNNYEYDFVNFNRSMFWGYERKNDFLIARPEKAFVDIVYLESMGFRKVDPEEWDLHSIDKKLLDEYSEMVTFIPFVKKMKRYLNKI